MTADYSGAITQLEREERELLEARAEAKRAAEAADKAYGLIDRRLKDAQCALQFLRNLQTGHHQEVPL